MTFILPVLIIVEVIMWMLKVDPLGDTAWVQWLWLTLGVHLLVGGGIVATVRDRVRRTP